MSGSARPPTVLGLCSFTHDSAAALISGGSLTGMAEEERLSGVKHTRDYPAGAVRLAAADAGMSAADVDIVAYNFAGHRYLAGIAGRPGHLLSPRPAPRALPRAASFAVVHQRFRRAHENLGDLFPNARVRGGPSPPAHGLYAYAASGCEGSRRPRGRQPRRAATTTIAHGHGVQRLRYRIAERSTTRPPSATRTAPSPSTWAGAAATRRAPSWRWPPR